MLIWFEILCRQTNRGVPEVLISLDLRRKWNPTQLISGQALFRPDHLYLLLDDAAQLCKFEEMVILVIVILISFLQSKLKWNV